jgi:hypothetical protein
VFFIVPMLTAISSAVASQAINSSAWGSPKLEPKTVAGVDSSTLAMYGGAALGTLALFAGMPFLAAPLLGIAAGSYGARDGLTRTRSAFQEFMSDRLLTGGPAAPSFQLGADAAAGEGDVFELGPQAPATLAARLAA